MRLMESGSVDVDRFPEWPPFVNAVERSDLSTGTWCEAWTVRDIVAHQAGNAEELARVLGAHLSGEPVDTRSFEEREAPLRMLSDADLWSALVDRMVRLGKVADAGDATPPDTAVAWTGRMMKVPWFAEHMREELVLHGWDVTGDVDAARHRLAQPWMTEHSVVAVGAPLLQRGAADIGLVSGERVEARLRTVGTDDVLVSADALTNSICFVPAVGPATLETDAATRVLLLWGRRPADPSRIRSVAGRHALGAVRRILAGY